MEQENWAILEPTITMENDISCVREKADPEIDSSGTLSGNFHIIHNVTGGKRIEEALHHTEKSTRPEPDIIVSTFKETDNLDLSDIIDVQAVQSLMDDFYKFDQITMALVDLKGNVLVSVGWQDICTRFHRIHPETCKYCVESDTILSAGVLPGEFKLYKCKNNMWDIATPIMVGGQHVGNIFSGQFFFENEPLDYEFFRSQAKKYGFNEEEYIAALEKVPRLSRETVDAGMTFLTKLANMISQLSYSNVKLSRSLVERNALVDSLRESEEKYRSVVETANEGIWIIDAEDRTIYVNKKMTEMLGYTQDEMIGRSGWDFTDEKDSTVPRLNREKRQRGIDESHEFKFICKDGSPLWALVNIKSLFDRDGKFAGSMGMLTDITERKEAEAKLKEAYECSEKLVKERTNQLEKAYNSLKESQEGLAEAQKMAQIGNWEWDIEADKAYWSEEMYRIFGRDLTKAAPSYNEYLSYIHPDDLDHYCDAIKKAAREKPFSIDYRIIPDNGEERTVHLTSEYVINNKNIPVKIKGTIQDISERKKSEEKIQLLANIVKSSNDAIGTISLDGIITSCNEEAEKVYGYPAEEIIGKPTSFVAPPYLDTETKKLCELIKHGKKIHHHETVRLRKDGKVINVSITLSPVFDSYGKLTAISFISRDITERKRVEEKLRESEEKYRNIVETANEGIFIIDAENRVTYANKKMMNMLGYTWNEIIGREVWDFVSEEGKAIIKRNQERRQQGINESYELELICKNGSSLWAIISAKSLFAKDGKFLGSISMLTDITKRKEAEDALENIEIARKKEIHHRIKNNLQVISSLLDLQAEKFNNRKDIQDSEVLEAFRESQDRVISMALIHEELYKGGGFDALNFSSYIEKLAENLFETYRLGNADLSLNMDLEENIFFDMDTAVPLGIIVNELVSNSLKHAFTEKGGEIQIRLCRKEKSTETQESLFSLTICDNGKGISENVDLENIESLGLKLVSILVNQLDGNMELKREHGTEFRISFKAVERS